MLGHGLHYTGQALRGMQRIELAEDPGRHLDPTLLLGRRDQAREDQGQAGPLRREPGDDLGPPPAFPEGALQQVGGAQALAMLSREQQVRQALGQVLLQALHGRGVSRPKSGDQGVAAAEAGRMIGREQHLLEERLQLRRRERRECRQDVPELMDWTPLPPRGCSGIRTTPNIMSGFPLRSSVLWLLSL